MWPFSRPTQPPTLDQEFITRYWDLSARVDSLESQLEGRLEYLEKTYKRAEQSERRLEQKRSVDSPCPDIVPDGAAPSSLYRLARRASELVESAGDSATG